MLTLHIEAQTANQIKTPLLGIQDVFIHVGFHVANNPESGLSDFRTLAPNSLLLKNDLSSFEINNQIQEPLNPVYSMQLGVQFRKTRTNSYHYNPLLRVGFNYSSISVINCSLSQQLSQTADTLTSSQTGQQYFVDSIFMQDFDMQLNAQMLQFDASLIFRTNPKLRLSAYAGVGFNLGSSINSTIDILYNENRYTNSQYEKKGSSFNSSTDKNTREYFNSGKLNSYSIYTPFGMDFRIGKFDEFLNNFHLFYEIRTGLQISNVNELRTINSTYFQNNIGVRVNWN
jgi:hypothetical protein